MAKRRIWGKIAVEQHRIVVVHPSGDPILHWCQSCHSQVLMVVPEEAAHRCRVSPRTIYRWIESAKVHFYENPEGAVLVCLNSISNRRRR